MSGTKAKDQILELDIWSALLGNYKGFGNSVPETKGATNIYILLFKNAYFFESAIKFLGIYTSATIICMHY